MFKNAPTGWKVNSTKNVYTNDLIELYEDTIPFVSANQILVIKSYRHIVDSVQIEAPSGI